MKQRVVWIKNSQSGFTLFELVIVIAMTGLLAMVALVKFNELRASQELNITASDFVSKIRDVQNKVLAGAIVTSGQAASAYEIIFSAGSGTYTLRYAIGGTNTTTLENVNLSPNVQIQQSVTVQIYAPFGRVYVGGAANQVARIDLRHSATGQIRSIIIDGISGRIGNQ